MPSEGLTLPASYELMGNFPCLDFVNTIHNYNEEHHGEELKSYRDLAVWGVMAGILTEAEGQKLVAKAGLEPNRAERTLEWGRRLRENIYLIFSVAAAGEKPAEEALRQLNGELALALRNAQVIQTEKGYGWDWGDKTSAFESILWPVARSAAELLTSDQLHRVRECAGENCTWLFLDTSKNGTRRWCDMKGCGNRAKAKRFYQKKRP